MVQTHPREVAAVKDQARIPPGRRQRTSRVSAIGAWKHNLEVQRCWESKKKNLFEKRDSRGAGGHSNRVQIFECLMVYG